ncbi:MULTISPECIES: DUF624 domain-containing protein [unclassified Actinomyces]|uniref:YesL family protein n=1 Tax=unclassified Actinomyces TaxID=2609248 RepID=UPI0020175184|nr:MULTISPECIES: DUF624 domain-containing protein [unclassified Actinomyces]MCL3777129.1 DUF624 domain-containing protein [Actinomyces sp. AC-20-1]MCL3788955.1 DUF624 domain-containing protein [Actinomyces sp. 187325]MCL3791315.1 DUF624 domain-containing protein [Actinomyces sp. 186855]MCL3794146.1 DUF624 domain-containing protein [Actinomyces sp. 217892]
MPSRILPAVVGWHVRLGELAGRLFVLHLVWVLGVLAGAVVLGAGPATLAMSAVIRRGLMNDLLEERGLRAVQRPGLWKEFWTVLRREFWHAQAIALAVGAGWVLLGVDRALLMAGVGSATPWLSGLVVVLSVLWAAASLVVWVVAAHFDESLRRVARLVVVLGLSRPVSSGGALLVAAAWLWLWTAYPGLVPVFGLALPARCVSWIYWRSGVLPLPEEAVPYEEDRGPWPVGAGGLTPVM